ncbi:MAG: Flp pilus assembly protein CpaB [Pseudomonadota bacterium]|jgi:pilus assembly protein CpaB
MDKKKLMLLMSALVIAIGTALAARSLLAGSSAPKVEAAQQVPRGPKVLVAQRALPVGTIITADAISFQAWPKEMVQDAYFIDGEADMNKLLGTVVRYPVTAGQPVTQGALVPPGDRGFLAAALGAGMRAITIPVSAKTGVGGFVFPGDHVDLMLTQSVRSNDSGDTLKAAETILRNVRVLATDQSTETTVEEGKTVVRDVRTVTLEVTPKIAEKIAVAQTIGTLSLSLRSLADNSSELDRAIASGTLKVPANASRQQEEKLLSDAMNRPIDGGGTFVTGGDVSRFQRRTMPAAPPVARAAEAAVADVRQPAASVGAVSYGPVVRVTRGKTTVAEPVRGR